MVLDFFQPLCFYDDYHDAFFFCALDFYTFEENVGSLGICAGIHLAVWQKIKAPDSWMFRGNFTTEENSVLWLLIPAAALILSLLLSYRQACLFYEKQV